MTESTAASVAEAHPLVRSGIYRLLAQGFRYPTKELFGKSASGDFVQGILGLMSGLPHLNGIAAEEAKPAERATKRLDGVSFEEFEVNYVRTFDVGFPEPPCPPYEGVHRKGTERTAVLLDVSEFYRHFGLGMSSEEGCRELPDHLSAELEFLHFLTFKEAQAREAAGEGAGREKEELLRGYILAQKDFIERHLLAWVAAFAEKVGKASNVPLHGYLARIVAEFLRRERDLVADYLEEPDA